MKARKILQKTGALALVGLLTVGSLAACGQDGTDSGSASSAVSSGVTSGVPAEASADNTELKSGSWTGTIGDKEVTIESAYIVDGIDAVIDGGTYESAAKDETVFLVVNGGSLTISNALVEKTNGETATSETTDKASEESTDTSQEQTADSKSSDQSSDSASDSSKSDSASSTNSDSTASTDSSSDSLTVDNGQGGPAGNGGTPPQMPSGDGSGAPSGTPPEMPSGDGSGAPSGTPPVKPGEASSTDSNTATGSNSGAPQGGPGGQGGGISSTEDGYNFYGLNSAIVCVGEDSTVTIDNCIINTDADGANAVFSTADSNIEAKNLEINTKQNSSRGLYSTYGGTITAENVAIVTQGAHCAPLATDRGGGIVDVTGGTLEAHGDGSPCIYSTGDIRATDVTGTSEQAQTLVIEGKNKVTLKDCDLTSTAENDGIMLYQSMSGDAADEDAAGNISTLTMEDSTLHYDGAGPFLYVTNTTTEVNATNCTFDYDGDTLVSAATGRWGNDGSNGGTLTMNVSGQTLTGKIAADSISKITVNLADGASHDGETEGVVTVK